MVLVGDALVPMDYALQPTFVSCAVLKFIGDFQAFLEYWKGQDRGEEDPRILTVYKKWLECCLTWLTESSSTPTALQLLNDSEPSKTSSQEAFIGESSRYPFLQQWLLVLSRMGVAFLDAPTEIKCIESPFLWLGQMQLPSRRQLFAVLAEQDDVMIEVLKGLVRITAPEKAISKNRNGWVPHSFAHLTDEYDPDLLFADLVDTLGRDHLVLLDLLVSNGMNKHLVLLFASH
ncbi:unnamed protein product [Phytophthora fragariaefolia]|uniref:Unnamed protein product n=1 Tax=Phytophthora fragariaefolia TaxID=1490495 RepID=A0A9W6U4D0_9STRA|nr:unnamed protein product [Phytophthora fragariaefolia]